MPTPASGSGRPIGDTTSPNAPAQALGSGTVLPIVPPRVTLTIEFGTLTLDSIKAISDFVQAALETSPASALGDASTGSRGEVPDIAAVLAKRVAVDAAPEGAADSTKKA